MKFRSDLILFFAEAFKRWGAKSPKYARVWKSINWLISASAGLPLILTQLDIILPPTWARVVLAIVAFATAYGGAMNTLQVSKPVDLPFTEKKQIQDEIKKVA